MTKRILFVDDDLDTCEMLQLLLNELGYEADTSTDALTALTKLEENDYSLVITDMCMPHMSGLELCGLIKKKFQNLKVIMLTGCGSLETALEAVKQGASNFLVKPIDYDQMDSLLNKAFSMN